MPKILNNIDMQIVPKSGLAANVNTTTTKALAIAGEMHYTTDAPGLWFFNGTENVQIAALATASQTGYTGDVVIDGTTLTYVNGILIGVA